MKYYKISEIHLSELLTEVIGTAEVISDCTNNYYLLKRVERIAEKLNEYCIMEKE